MKKEKKEKINKKLSQEIREMSEVDQKWRFKLIKLNKKNNSSNINRLWKKISHIDKRNTEKMKSIIKKYGWPTFSLVGKKSSNLAWLLVQHSTHDLKFQEECFFLLKKAVKKNDALPKNLAYLIDRIRTLKNKPQLFGTQFKTSIDGNPIPFPIYKPKEIDKRRKKYGLDTFEENKKRISKMYGKNTKLNL